MDLSFARRKGKLMDLQINLDNDDIITTEVVALYKANGWSSAEKPELLIAALKNSHSLVTARIDGKLVGIGNALSDGHLVVYYPHMLVHPDHKGKGIGRGHDGMSPKKIRVVPPANTRGRRQGRRFLQKRWLRTRRQHAVDVDLRRKGTINPDNSAAMTGFYALTHVILRPGFVIENSDLHSEFSMII